MKYVWLCGASEKVSFEDSNNWRKECVSWFKFNSKSFRAWNPNEYYSYSERRHNSDLEILLFCLRKVTESKAILVNLDNIRMSVGSIVELAWAYLLRKPVIGFYEGYKGKDDDELRNAIHSWVYEFCWRIELGDEAMLNALDYVEEYYG